MDITLRSRRPLISAHNSNVSHPHCVAVTSLLCTQSHCATHCLSCRGTTKGSTTRNPSCTSHDHLVLEMHGLLVQNARRPRDRPHELIVQHTRRPRAHLNEIASSDVLEEIKKRAIYEVFKDRADARIDPEAITHLVISQMEDRPAGGGHWTTCLDQAIEDYMEKLVEELAEELRRS